MCCMTELEAALWALTEETVPLKELIESLDAIAAEALPDLPPAPRPERALNMWPHQIPRRRPVPMARRYCSPYQR